MNTLLNLEQLKDILSDKDLKIMLFFKSLHGNILQYTTSVRMQPIIIQLDISHNRKYRFGDKEIWTMIIRNCNEISVCFHHDKTEWINVK